jgi:hypothetical protein
MKKCARCERELPFDAFYQNTRGGYAARCKECHGVEVRSCRHCGQHFLGLADKRFCSADCRRADDPPTYKSCASCGRTFGPVNHLARKYCSRACAVKGRSTGRKKFRKTHRRARTAQSLLRYHIVAKHIIRPAVCEECGATGRPIEGAHYNYDEPLRVRWLCRSCHRRWDKRQPKGATYVISDGQGRGESGFDAAVAVRRGVGVTASKSGSPA